MRIRSFLKFLLSGLAMGLACYAAPRGSRAATVEVHSGYDLFQTIPSGTSFPGLGNLKGVPYGTFDFGSGAVFTGTTDTIVHRLDDAIATAPPFPVTAPTIRLLMVGLQLETVIPVNFAGNGLDNYFVTLQSARPQGGTASTGTMDITFASAAGGTFNSSLDVFFDIHKGSLSGAIVASSDTVLTTTGSPWGRIPPPGAMLIPGVNFLLNGTDTSQDFWPAGGLHTGPHEVGPALRQPPVPEPGTWILYLTAGAIVPAYARFHRRRA
jgi:hypothetical protein